MTKHILSLTMVFAVIFATGFTIIQKSKDMCNPVEMKKKTEPMMKPFTYDSAKLTRINLTKKPMMQETEVPLSLFGAYRLVFNTMAMPKKIGINVYNKDKSSSKRTLLFSNKDSLETNTDLIYNPEKHTRKVYVDYDIPADSLNLKIKGCVYFMLGYK